MHKWSDFAFNLFPCVYFMRDTLCDHCDNVDTFIGIGWLCFAIELHW